MYVSHAHTLDELRTEVVSDLSRRINFLQGQSAVTARSVAEKSRLACAIRELEAMQSFWQELVLVRAKKKAVSVE